MWRRRHGLIAGRAAFDPSGGDASFSSVKLLAGWEGADGATSYTEESPSARVATFAGNGQISTAQFKFGASSYKSDGTGDRVTFPADNASWVLSPSANSDQFTVESWVRPAVSTITGQMFFALADGSIGSLNSWYFGISAGSANQLEFGISTAGNGGFDVTLTSTGITWGANTTWYHIAADKDSGGKLRIYRDGSMLASSTPANSIMHTPATPPLMRIGTNATAACFNGWMDETRITKGVARYASDGGYTVPTAAFPRH